MLNVTARTSERGPQLGRKLYAPGVRRARAHIGKSIRRQRLERGLNLAQLGRATGLSHSFLSQVEHGHTYPSFLSFLDIADALEVDPGELLRP